MRLVRRVMLAQAPAEGRGLRVHTSRDSPRHLSPRLQGSLDLLGLEVPALGAAGRPQPARPARTSCPLHVERGLTRDDDLAQDYGDGSWLLDTDGIEAADQHKRSPPTRPIAS